MPAIRIGYSADPDDAFMLCALMTGKVAVPGADIEYVADDVESLNRRARAAELEVTAVSAATYALVADRYRLLDCGAAMADGPGPVVVAREPIARGDIPDRVVAIPGSHTTSSLLLRVYVPDEPALIEVAFDKIAQVVLEGQADLGLLIHEGQLTHATLGLVKVLDLGAAWRQDTSLPLPLGVNLVRRDLPEATQRELSRALRDSIVWARANVDEALAFAMRYARGMDADTCRRFVSLYVNDDAVTLGTRGRAALERLFTMAHHRKLIPSVPLIDPI